MDELSMTARTLPLDRVIRYLHKAYLDDTSEKTGEKDAAFSAAISVMMQMQEAGANDAEQVADILHDYNGLAKQYQGLHDRFEVPRKPAHADGVWHCPRCNKRVGFNNTHCHWCGQKIKWG